MIKEQVRQRVKQWIKAADASSLKEEAELIQKQLLCSEVLLNFKTVALYVAMADEVTLDFLQIKEKLGGNKTFLLPRYNAEYDSYDMVEISDIVTDTVVGKYGILEPASHLPVRDPDGQTLILIPGRAFTKGGIRLGRGKAYYDRLLCHSAALKVGVCWNEQIFSDLPCDKRDIRMDYLLSRDGFLKCD
jgi:5-formyltetrahydrofolate cyclo-ligase